MPISRRPFGATDGSTVRQIVVAVEPFEVDRIYGAWWSKTVATDAKAAV